MLKWSKNCVIGAFYVRVAAKQNWPYFSYRMLYASATKVTKINRHFGTTDNCSFCTLFSAVGEYWVVFTPQYIFPTTAFPT